MVHGERSLAPATPTPRMAHQVPDRLFRRDRRSVGSGRRARRDGRGVGVGGPASLVVDVDAGVGTTTVPQPWERRSELRVA